MIGDLVSKCNILFICDFPFAGAGGVGRVTEVLAAEFMRCGCVVGYLALCTGVECDINGVRQHFVPERKLISCETNWQYVRDLLGKLHIDIIINQAGTKIEVLNFLACAKLGRPILSVHHNCVLGLRDSYRHILTEHFKNRFFFKLLDHSLGWLLLDRYHIWKQGNLFRKVISGSDRLVLLNSIFVPELNTYVSSHLRGKVIGIPNPASFPVVDGVEVFKENRLVFVGRLDYHQKRADLLLHLWKELYSKFPDWQFDILGDGPARTELVKKASSDGLERIHFRGYQDPRPYLEKAKFFCMTSAFEGFGMVLVEAQAYGVVPFAFDCFSAMSDIIQSGENGFVFPKFEMSQYTYVLKLLMNNEQERKRLAVNAQVAVTKYSPARIGDKWLNLFDEILQERKRTLS